MTAAPAMAGSSALPQQPSHPQTTTTRDAAPAAASSAPVVVVMPWTRLIWAEFSLPDQTNNKIWWPALVFQNASEMSQYLGQELHSPANVNAKCKLALAILTGSPNQSFVQFLGRPLQDLSSIQDHTYRDFYLDMESQMGRYIKKSAPFQHNQGLYLDWHRGLDQAIHIINQTPGVVAAAPQKSWLEKAQEAWEEQADHHAAMEPPGSPVAQQSVAAVSLMTEDASYYQGSPHQASAANQSTATTPRDHDHEEEQGEPEDQYEQQEHEEDPTSGPPPLQSSPIRDTESWEDAWTKMTLSGWTLVLQGGEKKYHPPPGYFQGSGGLSMAQAQNFAKEHYGWKNHHPKKRPRGRPRPRQNPAPAPMVSRGRRGSAAAEPEKKRTFGVLWARLQSKGWTLQRPKRRSGRWEAVDWLYVKPGVNVETGIEGHDYFISVDDVMAYFQATGEYPTSSSEEASTPSSAASATTFEDEDMDTALPQSSDSEQEEGETASVDRTHDETASFYTAQEDDGWRTPTNAKTQPQDPGKPLFPQSASSSSSLEYSIADPRHPDYYEWKVLWPRLKKYGWRWIRARNNLDNYWYVRPNRQPNVRGVDYFVEVEDIIQWCREQDAKDNPQLILQHQEETKPPSSSKAKRAATLTPTRRRGKPSEANTAQEPLQAKKRIKINDQTHAATSKTAIKSSKGYDSDNKKSSNAAPWVTHPFGNDVFKLCEEAIGLGYQSNYYLDNGETRVRFDSLLDVQKHCCSNAYKFVPGASPEVQQLFARWANYGFVPGSFHQWRETACPNRNQVVEWLKQLGYNKQHSRAWKPPSHLVGKVLEQEYSNLNDLCRALRCLPDLEVLSRRRNYQSKLSNENYTALRLWIAEGLFLNATQRSKDGISSDEDSVKEEGTRKKAKNTISSIDMTASTSASEATKPASKSKKSPLTDLSALTLEAAQALVDGLKVNPGDWLHNQAIWAVNSPCVNNLYKILEGVGVTCSSGKYYLPGENSKHHSVRLNSSNELVSYWGTHGHIQLSKFQDSNDRLAIQRLINYANVPGARAEWMRVREISPEEAGWLLIVLGFTCHADGSWTVPEHIETPRREYTSLQRLCRALRRVPSLDKADKRSGRPSRRVQSSVIHEKQMLALRLRIAEDFDPTDRDEEKEIKDEDEPMTETAAVTTNLEPMNDENDMPIEDESAAKVLQAEESSKMPEPMTETAAVTTNLETMNDENDMPIEDESAAKVLQAEESSKMPEPTTKSAGGGETKETPAETVSEQDEDEPMKETAVATPAPETMSDETKETPAETLSEQDEDEPMKETAVATPAPETMSDETKETPAETISEQDEDEPMKETVANPAPETMSDEDDNQGKHEAIGIDDKALHSEEFPNMSEPTAESGGGSDIKDSMAENSVMEECETDSASAKGASKNSEKILSQMEGNDDGSNQKLTISFASDDDDSGSVEHVVQETLVGDHNPADSSSPSENLFDDAQENLDPNWQDVDHYETAGQNDFNKKPLFTQPEPEDEMGPTREGGEFVPVKFQCSPASAHPQLDAENDTGDIVEEKSMCGGLQVECQQSNEDKKQIMLAPLQTQPSYPSDEEFFH